MLVFIGVGSKSPGRNHVLLQPLLFERLKALVTQSEILRAQIGGGKVQRFGIHPPANPAGLFKHHHVVTLRNQLIGQIGTGQTGADNCYLHHILLFGRITCRGTCQDQSLCSASIGLSCEALMAGNTPNPTPTAKQMPSDRKIASIDQLTAQPE